jgi:hypothetical protein
MALDGSQLRLLNLMQDCRAEPPPDREEKIAWLETFLPEIQARSEADLPDSATNRDIDKLVVAAVFVRWRFYLRRTGRDFSPAIRPSPREIAARRDIEERAAAIANQPAPSLPAWIQVRRH